MNMEIVNSAMTEMNAMAEMNAGVTDSAKTGWVWYIHVSMIYD
jgi:hypothetical protein